MDVVIEGVVYESDCVINCVYERDWVFEDEL